MTEADLLQQVFERLSLAGAGGEVFDADEVRQWPDGALASLIKVGVFRPAQPAQILECDGCERNCFKPVYVRVGGSARAARAFISCDEPEDVGRIPVDLSRLERWQITCESLADAVARGLGFTKPTQPDGTGGRWVLGLLAGSENKGMVTLSIENGVMLMLAGNCVPLSHVLALRAHGLEFNKEALLRMVDADAREPVAGIGSPEWRRLQARAAAHARHSKPGGSQDKQRQIRAAWATGKYTSRDRCAEEEYAGLKMPFSTARKALRNTPDPKRRA